MSDCRSGIGQLDSNLSLCYLHVIARAFCSCVALVFCPQIDGESKGPHLFWSRIAERPKGLFGGAKGAGARPVLLPGVSMDSLPSKAALKGLDNASVAVLGFRVWTALRFRVRG